MPFNDDIDQLKIVERNINRLVAVEKDQAVKILKVFQEGRRRMRQQLTSSAPDSFTQARVQTTLQEAELMARSLNEASKRRSSESFKMVQEQGVEDLGKEISKFSTRFEGISRNIPVDQILFSMESENLLLNQFQASIDTYTKKFRDHIQRELTQAVLTGEPSTRLINRILDEWALQDFQVLRIVRTELHNVYNMSKNEGMLKTRNDSIPDLKKTLIHPMDGRTGEDSKLAARSKLIVDIDKSFSYTWNGTNRVFFAPPDRPNDRSILVPYRDEWDN